MLVKGILIILVFFFQYNNNKRTEIWFSNGVQRSLKCEGESSHIETVNLSLLVFLLLGKAGKYAKNMAIN
jgi:hypothetical protein